MDDEWRDILEAKDRRFLRFASFCRNPLHLPSCHEGNATSRITPLKSTSTNIFSFILESGQGSDAEDFRTL